MQSYKISLHHFKTIDGWPIVRNHREFLSCTVTSFSFRDENNNSEKKGVWRTPAHCFQLGSDFGSFHHCSTSLWAAQFFGFSLGLCFQETSLLSKALQRVPQSFWNPWAPCKCSKGIPNFPAFPEPASPSLQDGKVEGVTWLTVNGLGAALPHLQHLQTWLESSCLLILWPKHRSLCCFQHLITQTATQSAWLVTHQPLMNLLFTVNLPATSWLILQILAKDYSCFWPSTIPRQCGWKDLSLIYCPS